MALPCKDLIDSHIEQIYMQVNQLDCVDLHGKDLTKMSVYKSAIQDQTNTTVSSMGKFNLK